MQEKTVSVLITARNVDENLRRQLDTILPQLNSENSGEIVLGLDPSCSSDLNLVDLAQGDGARLVVCHSRAPGIPAGRNACLQVARNKFVLFCDSDDRVSDSWVEDHLQRLQPDLVTAGVLELADINGEPLGVLDSPLIAPFDFLPFWLTANLGVSHESAIGVGGFDESISHGEDVNFTWRLQLSGCS